MCRKHQGLEKEEKQKEKGSKESEKDPRFSQMYHRLWTRQVAHVATQNSHCGATKMETYTRRHNFWYQEDLRNSI